MTTMRLGHGHGLDLVMGDIDRGAPDALVQREQLGAHLHPQQRVEVGQRLVHEEGPGSRTIARPSATRWRCPPESSSGLRSSCSSSSSTAAASPTVRAISSRPTPPELERKADVLRAPSYAGRGRSSGTPSRRRARRVQIIGEAPADVDLAVASRSSSPAISLSSGALAAARGPSRTMNSPGAMSRSMPLSDGDSP